MYYRIYPMHSIAFKKLLKKIKVVAKKTGMQISSITTEALQDVETNCTRVWEDSREEVPYVNTIITLTPRGKDSFVGFQL